MSNSFSEFDLFLDESGDFRETSTDAGEREASTRQVRTFPSQIAGVLARRGSLTTGKARTVLNQALSNAGLPVGPVHANKLPRYAYDNVVRTVVTCVRANDWQPVRVVNRERVQYGDRVATYTSMVAELLLRVCQQLSITGESSIRVRLRCARVVIREEPNGTLAVLEHDAYLEKVQYYLGFAAVRKGLSQKSATWRLDGLILGSGKDDPELQLCDILSHASHDGFSPCVDETSKRQLRAAFGTFDFTLFVRELNERVDRLLADDLLSAAVQSLAVELLRQDLATDARTDARERLTTTLSRLSEISAAARDSHLGAVVSWLEQIIDVQRSLDLGRRLIRWLRSEVLTPLKRALESGPEAAALDWFDYALHVWALTACNHRGALVEAREESGALTDLLPSIAGHWDHIPLLMRGLVTDAVHKTDCFELAHVADRMSVVARYYSDLGGLFNSALPSVFPERVRSDLCGRALGTWLQSEIYAGLLEGDTGRLARARTLSDQAIDEFVALADKERQYQYRSQLETAAGVFSDAHHWLALSLRLDDDRHLALARAVQHLGESSEIAQGFAQLHWFRLGVTALLDGATEEGSGFLSAFRLARADHWPWSLGERGNDYPAHGILRRVAVIHAARGELGDATDALRRLAEMLSALGGRRPLFTAIRAAAHAETAAALPANQFKMGRRFLDSAEVSLPGLRQQLEDLRAQTEIIFPQIWCLFEPWESEVRGFLNGDPTARSHLLILARKIGY
jgi:hypothetical protein